MFEIRFTKHDGTPVQHTFGGDEVEARQLVAQIVRRDAEKGTPVDLFRDAVPVFQDTGRARSTRPLPKTESRPPAPKSTTTSPKGETKVTAYHE